MRQSRLAVFGQEVHGSSTAILDMGTVQILKYGLLALDFVDSLYTAYRTTKNNQPSGKVWGTFVPYAALIVVLTVMNVYLFMLPMAMRL